MTGVSTAARRVLVLQFRRIGDAILTTPLLATLRRARPAWRVTVLVDEGCHEPLVDHPDVDELLVLPRDHWNDARLFPAALRAVRRSRPDVVLDVLSTPLSAFVARASGAPRRIGFDLRWRRRFYTDPVRRDAAPVYTGLARQALLAPLGIEPVDAPPSVGRGFADTAGARAALARAGVRAGGETIVALSPTSRRSARRWPLTSYAAAGAALADAGLRVLALWGPGERGDAEAVASASDGRVAVAPATRDLRALAGLLVESAALVGNDNGTRHLAVALGVPTVGVFGPTLPATCTPSGPAGARHVTLRGGCTCADHRRCVAPPCLASIAPGAVVDATLALLSRAAGESLAFPATR